MTPILNKSTGEVTRWHGPILDKIDDASFVNHLLTTDNKLVPNFLTHEEEFQDKWISYQEECKEYAMDELSRHHMLKIDFAPHLPSKVRFGLHWSGIPLPTKSFIVSVDKAAQAAPFAFEEVHVDLRFLARCEMFRTAVDFDFYYYSYHSYSY